MKARFGIAIFSIISGLLVSSIVNNAAASTLVFTGQNAALFNTANPNDTSTLMNSVVKPNNPNGGSGSALSGSNFIIQSLESQIITRDYNQIFNTAGGQGGSFIVGNTTVTYDNGVTNPGFFTITITTGGKSTTITVPN